MNSFPIRPCFAALARWILLVLVFVALPPASAAPLRIMPLGDSITAGYTDNPPSGGTGGWTVPFEFGYRKQLYQLLHNAGYDFVFVGASPEPWVSNYGDPTHGGTVSPTFDLRPIGQDGHRGYGGYRIPPITNAVAGFINTDNPDIILLLLGINGIDSGSPAEMDLLVETIFNAKPAVKLIIAQITPKSSSYTTDNASIRSFNAYIAATLVPKYLGQGRSISMVNQYVNFLTNPGDLTSINNSLFSNGINHPTNAVYDIMAGTWFSGIQAITPPASPLLSVTQFTSSITAGGTIGSFSHTPSPSSDTYIYSLVSGAGATDNAKFNISGNLLLAGSYPFSSDPNGSMYAIRVRATGVSSGQVGEQTFTLTAISDSDGDLIPDAWEIAKAGNLTSLTAVGDFDSDGLTDRAEYNLSMGAYANIDPTNADSDSDGLSDGEEINGAGQRPPTNPTLADTDGDSVSDFNEDNTGTFVSILKTGTNPTIPDSDGDGVNDGAEILQSTNPADAASPGPPSIVGVSSGTVGSYAGSVSTSDLLHGLSGTNAVHTGWYLQNNASPTKLNDGLHGGVGTSPVEGGWSQATGSVSTYTLPTGAGRGWDITNITTIADWSGGGFGNQRYEAAVRRVGDAGFSPLATVNFQPYNTTGVGASKVQITRAGGKLAGGVQQIRFTMLSTNGNSGRAVYREFDVFGTESSAPLTEILTTTGPTAATSKLAITWRSYPGKTYRVEASENLAGWNMVASAFPSGGVTTTFWQTIQLALTPRVFFRVSTNP